MINFDEYLKSIKSGDVLTIVSRPDTFAHEAGGNKGLDRVKYPYTLTIEKFNVVTEESNRYGTRIYIAIKDTNNYAWSLKSTNSELFKLESNRKSRIDSLNL